MPGLSSSLVMVTVARSDLSPSGVWPLQCSLVVYLPATFRSAPVVSGSSSMVTEPSAPKAESSTVVSSMILRVSFCAKVIAVGSAPVMYSPFCEARRATTVSDTLPKAMSNRSTHRRSMMKRAG